ncbi:MAG: 3-hydroxyacyl-CoA dehydrogenase NAD-binding domain-containing protein [Thermoleophilaceae bacterium]
MSELPQRLGVVGAGTMGSGIAQLGCLAGIATVLHDPLPEALERGAEGLRRGLVKGAERGRWSEADAAAAAGRLETAGELGGLAGCDLVIEAAPERPGLKRELFASLSEVCGPDAVYATNTSSIPVTSLASAAARPEHVVGMHFFNPAPLMRLVEVIAAEQSSERALALATATGEAMGKRVIRASDGPGFLVNRCGRPFGAEALRLVQERVATPEQVDRICRLGGGFRMGPFELMDLVGIDVGFEVAKSFTELSFGEPRWKPSPLQARMVAAGRLGRKAGRGWYEYGDGPHRPDDPEPPAPGGGDGRALAIGGEGPVPELLRARAEAAGYAVSGDGGPGAVSLEGAPIEGFSVLPPEPRLVELGGERDDLRERLFTSLGFVCEWVEDDAPGLVLARIVCQLVNEACFAIGEGVGSPEDVDAGMTLGLNHPRGPMAWGEAIGFASVLATIDRLWEERREERYRAAPLLRRLAREG